MCKKIESSRQVVNLVLQGILELPCKILLAHRRVRRRRWKRQELGLGCCLHHKNLCSFLSCPSTLARGWNCLWWFHKHPCFRGIGKHSRTWYSSYTTRISVLHWLVLAGSSASTGVLVNLHLDLDERGSQGSLGHLVKVSISMAQTCCKSPVTHKTNIKLVNIAFLCYRAQEFWTSLSICMLDLDRLGLSCLFLFSILASSKCVNIHLSYLRMLMHTSILFFHCFSLLLFHSTSTSPKKEESPFSEWKSVYSRCFIVLQPVSYLYVLWSFFIIFLQDRDQAHALYF